MPITANVINEQITASVGETQIDVSVSGGIGPAGPAGASSWNDITGKPTTFSPSAHTHDYVEIAGGSTFTNFNTTAGSLATALSGIDSAISGKAAAATGDYTNPSGIADSAIALYDTALQAWWLRAHDGEVIFETGYAAAMLSAIGGAALSHAHGAITSDGKVGTTAGLVLKTGTAGAVEALAQGTAGQVLKVNSGATGVEWGAAAADVSIDITAADILSASSGSITADDPGADRIVFWDDSASKLTHLAVGTGLSISGTTLSAGDQAVTSPSQITANQNDYASFARGINRFTTDASRNLTGMVAGSDGEVRVLCNVGTTAANTLVIKDESSSSTAANRFSVPWNGDCVIPAEGSVVVFYDGTSSRWRVV